MSKSTPVRNILITGSSRGLGYEFVRQYLLEPNTHIIATARNLTKATALQELKNKHENVTLIEMDVSSPESVQSALKSLPPLALVINNAGISMGAQGIQAATIDELHTTFNTNVGGVFVTIQATLDALKRGISEYNIRPVVANISTTLGSIKTTNEQQLFEGLSAITYRISKAALNMLTVAVSKEYPEITFVSLCPGWCDTDMGRGGRFTPPLKPEQSISGMRSVIDKLKPEQTGHFISYDGTEIAF